MYIQTYAFLTFELSNVTYIVHVVNVVQIWKGHTDAKSSQGKSASLCLHMTMAAWPVTLS